MTFIDWTIIAVFLIGLISIGFLFSKRNKNLEDYFLGGRSMPTWLVAFAATGTSISAGTFVGSPELGFNTNLTYLMLCVGAIFGGLLVALLVLPELYNANTITIYGYLGDRFGDSAKNSSSVMFLVGQLFTSGSRLFIAAIAVSVILYGNIQFEFLMYSIIILGVISTIYTMAGGIKGLIYIDTIQILLVVGTGVVALLAVYFSMTPHMSLGEIFASLTSGEVKNAAGEWVAGNKLQIVDGKAYYEENRNSVASSQTVAAARGSILDRYGRVLVSNTSCNNLVFNPDDLFEQDDPNGILLKLARTVVSCGDTYVDELPVTTAPPFEYTDMTETQRTQLKGFLKYAKLDEEATAVELLSYCREKFEINNNYSAADMRTIAGQRY